MSSPETSPSSIPSGGAVFVSYASQDAVAARRIVAALRAAGVEVWFDQNELVGGDAWDRKIRGQIGACALFVPVVSAATQARREGYFRLEWKLADERTHLMAEGTPFILPVVIDDTKDREALVPKSFLAVQWTRAAGGEVTGAFGGRVRSLLGGEEMGVGPGADRAPGQRPGLQPKITRRVPVAAWGVAILVLAAVGVGWWQQAKPAPNSVPNAGAGTRPPTSEKAPPTKAVEKSVAVLPFVTSGADKDDENLADGIADELLTQLGRAPGLRVSGRLSSFSFKGQKLTDAEIARKLDVEYLVTGTFQKNGSQVRIRPQLINAANGSVLWAETFTKELKNVFALQDEVVGLIAQAFQVKFGTAARATRTVNPAAYGLVQRGRYLWLKRSDDALGDAIAAYEEAIKLDQNYAEAYAGLADAALVRGWYSGLEVMNVSAGYFAQARAAAQRALQIDATLAEPHAALAAVNMNEDRFEEAEQEFQAALRLNPNYSYAHHWRAHLLSAQGRLDEAIAEIDRAVQIDPYSLATLVIGATLVSYADRYSDALALGDRAVAVRQNDFIPADGMRALSLFMLGRRDEAVTAARVVTKSVTIKPRWWVDITAMHVLRKSGYEGEAKAHADRLLASASANSYFRIYIAAAFGRSDEALDELKKAPVPPTNRTTIFYSEVWAEVRRSPRFPEVMKELGWWKHYELANATKARMLREQAGKQ